MTETTKAPAKAKAVEPKAPAPKKIKVLIAEPKLRGSRAERFPLVLQAKTVDELATLLKEAGFKQSAAGTIRWLVKAKIAQVG